MYTTEDQMLVPASNGLWMPDLCAGVCVQSDRKVQDVGRQDVNVDFVASLKQRSLSTLCVGAAPVAPSRWRP